MRYDPGMSPTKTIRRLLCVCRHEDCGHRWTSEGAKPPIRCPKCFRRTWNRARILPGPKAGRPPLKRGPKPRKGD